jgi:K+-transporting ATPase ATPase A chain
VVAGRPAQAVRGGLTTQADPRVIRRTAGADSLFAIFRSGDVVQTLGASQTATLLQPTSDANGNKMTEQVLAVGPAASQIAIKQLGTNGGGFFNVNSAHPFENPTPFSNFLELLAILLIRRRCATPSAGCWQHLAKAILARAPLPALLGRRRGWQQATSLVRQACRTAALPCSLAATWRRGRWDRQLRLAYGDHGAFNGSVNTMHDSDAARGWSPGLMVGQSFGGISPTLRYAVRHCGCLRRRSDGRAHA